MAKAKFQQTVAITLYINPNKEYDYEATIDFLRHMMEEGHRWTEMFCADDKTFRVDTSDAMKERIEEDWKLASDTPLYTPTEAKPVVSRHKKEKPMTVDQLASLGYQIAERKGKKVLLDTPMVGATLAQ